ncbi:hypothetical protein [Calditerrivibrio nitroreducens]|uniref:Uncharacterized protein n=1 Tax=Calditerrivibrio nitroreducens (strain DSM 19672 / NBRC 101217 / Yu37-1) TaxID=768670 RepID=E4TKB4_CALNY|nr:hypothetical protein [Calditerrivibrio nitroreducens]ADR19986.1 hypothetical protein Calni_2096 [Calditerrivibrio nitroreducens DSM 19672]
MEKILFPLFVNIVIYCMAKKRYLLAISCKFKYEFLIVKYEFWGVKCEVLVVKTKNMASGVTFHSGGLDHGKFYFLSCESPWT